MITAVVLLIIINLLGIMRFFTVILSLFSILCSSQTTVYGEVHSNGYPIKNADIIHYQKRFSTQTDTDGSFEIKVSLNDTLIISKERFNIYTKVINKKDLELQKITIPLSKQAFELEEVIVEKVTVPKLDPSIIIQKQFTPDAMTSPSNPFIYDGSTTGGGNILGLLNPLINLFKSNKKKVEYGWLKPVLSKYFDNKYLLTNFNLFDFELDNFIKYCESDPNTMIVSNTNDSLALIEFLKKKSIEFKELHN